MFYDVLWKQTSRVLLLYCIHCAQITTLNFAQLQMLVLSKKNKLVVVCFLFLLDRALDVHDVRVDQLVGLQRVLRDGDEVSRAICQTVSRGRLTLPAQH